MKAKFIKSKNLTFETVSLCDVDFIHFCRMQEKNKDYLIRPKSIIDHIKFLKNEIEDDTSEYYLIKENISGKKIGLVRISNIDKINKLFSWGSWSFIDGVNKSYAIESAFIIYSYFFNLYKFEKCLFKVKKDNTSVNRFHLFYGSEILSSDDDFNYYAFLRKSYENIDSKFHRYIYEINIGEINKENFFIHELADVKLENIKDNCLFWQYAVVCQNTKIGHSVSINSNVFIDNNVEIGNQVIIKNNSLIYSGVVIGNNIFIGPNVVFTNDKYMFSRGKNNINFIPDKTIIGSGTSIGANVTILPGVAIGKNCLIGAGSVVTKDIPDNNIFYNKLDTVQFSK